MPSALRVLFVAPGARTESDSIFLGVSAASAAGSFDLERAIDCSETGLRERLAGGAVNVVHVLAHGKSKAVAKYAVINLDDSRGAPRTVNGSHFAGIVVSGGKPALVVLQARDAGEDLSGLALALREQGVAAVITTGAMGAKTGPFAARLYRELGRGRSYAEAINAAREILVADVETDRSVRLLAADPDGSVSNDATPLAAAASAPAPLAGSESRSAPGNRAAVDSGAATPRREPDFQRLLADKRAAGLFDVFLCHNSIDKPAVKNIAARLKARGILPWLDEWELPPGQPWQPLLERQIGRIQSAAVFVGKAGVGPWQEQELNSFLREFVARKAPVIPLLLPDAPATPEVPIFLSSMTYVDFRISDPDPMSRLVWGITGVRPDDDA